MAGEIIIGILAAATGLGAYLSARRMSHGPAEYYGQTFVREFWRRPTKRRLANPSADPSAEMTKEQLIEFLRASPNLLREVVGLVEAGLDLTKSEPATRQVKLELTPDASAELERRIIEIKLATHPRFLQAKQQLMAYRSHPSFNETRIRQVHLMEPSKTVMARVVARKTVHLAYSGIEPPTSKNEELEKRVEELTRANDEMEIRLRAVEETLTTSKAKKEAAVPSHRYIQ